MNTTSSKQIRVIKDPMLAEVSMSYRSKIKPADRPKITSSKNAYNYLRTIFNPDTIEHHEEFYIILIGQSSKVLGWVKIASGNIDNCLFDSRIIFQCALLANATGVILCHNHPSGNLTPSQQDIYVTRRIRSAGLILNIQVLDHIIITSESYYSFGDEGML